jgi:hypothetical protein
VLVLDGVAELDDGPDAFFPLEQPARPATIVTAAMAINNSRFTKFSLAGVTLSSSMYRRATICSATSQ